jgi:hypothetical protein
MEPWLALELHPQRRDLKESPQPLEVDPYLTTATMAVLHNFLLPLLHQQQVHQLIVAMQQMH